MSEDMTCAACGSPNIEEDTPTEGTHTCRDCGEWLDDKGQLV